MNAPVRLLVLLSLALSCAGPARGQTASLPPAGSRAFGAGFGVSFQSPPPRIIPAPGGAAGSFLPGGAPYAPARIAGPAIPAPRGFDARPPHEQCRAAIAAAETRHGIPRGLLAAIGAVESGRRDPATGERAPWPWTINAEGQGRYFDAKAEAVAWVTQARAGGMRSIDTGCMQVNMLYHPDAFASLDQAFDPAANADYAARFLVSLRDGPAGGDWMRAVGYYHSQTPERAENYRRAVQAALDGAGRAGSGAGQPGRPYGATSVAYGGGPSVGRAASPPAAAPASAVPVAARPADGGPAFLSNRAESASVIAAPAGSVGRGLDAYRAAPIALVTRLAMR